MLGPPDVAPRNGTILGSACCMYISIMYLMEYWQADEELYPRVGVFFDSRAELYSE